MVRRPRPLSPQEVLRGHYETVAGLIGSGAAEVEVNVALTAAEQAGLDRTALQMAVREGRLADRERRAEVAAELDRYRALLDRDGDAPAVAAEAGPSGKVGPHGSRLR